MSVASLFGLAPLADIKIQLADTEKRKTFDTTIQRGHPHEKLPLYFDREAVRGKVMIIVGPGKRLEHHGIRVECVGSIVIANDSSQSKEFVCLSQELAAPGEIRQNTVFEFEFRNVEKQYECYYGINVQLRYFVRTIVSKRMGNMIKEADMLVRSYQEPKQDMHLIKMEVGIEDCLHIEFEYNKSKYHMKDVIVGKIFFLLVRIKIKHMELCIVRRETTGSGQNTHNESETIAKFEIMDGAPVRGEYIRIHLEPGGLNVKRLNIRSHSF
ncbi:vacuolar protein sorting-associated protein 26-domain-containing protein [Dichotomocladium elegans]|nr:vacuolar protein sorting-associated protein 26-domain-containing protein [Dichotomocladium elegans]